MRVDLLNLMLADAGLAALCSDQMSWFERPQDGGVPAIVLHMISNVPSYTYQGESSRKFNRVQGNLYAKTDMEIVALVDAFKSALSGYRGTIGATSFKGIFIDGSREGVDPGKSDDEKLFVVSIDLRIHHKEI